ncbi:hypothetical protein D9M69_535720 [compost metagenome]
MRVDGIGRVPAPADHRGRVALQVVRDVFQRHGLGGRATARLHVRRRGQGREVGGLLQLTLHEEQIAQIEADQQDGGDAQRHGRLDQHGAGLAMREMP